ncbi:MAG: FHA domain-containing protein [Oscillospiraceae bacterium]|nr:FHA domain-containing protein [Oscillospiraceae bacterium]
MNNSTRCQNGHFYDVERFPAGCPYCNQKGVSTVGFDEESNEKIYTQPLDDEDSGYTTVKGPGGDDGQATIGIFKELKPVVGWLVCIEGNHVGEDFTLRSGRNFIGRNSDMDVVLGGDGSVSRDKHAIIVYEPKGNVFLVQPGDARELFYLNDHVVLSAKEIESNDVLLLGETKLMFIPCCSERFNWDALIKAEEKK